MIINFLKFIEKKALESIEYKSPNAIYSEQYKYSSFQRPPRNRYKVKWKQSNVQTILGASRNFLTYMSINFILNSLRPTNADPGYYPKVIICILV